MNYVQKVPVAICGVALGFAALGNLFKASFEGLYLACGILSIALLALYTFKFMVMTKVVLRELSDPIGLSVAATYPMAVMLISVYMKAANPLMRHVRPDLRLRPFPKLLRKRM